ncbi:MAG TPA: cbb3-type cytochrome c oxidase subunit I [Acidobacteriaceae bacterium]|nr:cbb3-type cytochrome c oxidase subunit I [Acidobacteriaceae bacterium]
MTSRAFSRIFTIDHRRLGILYLYLALAAVIVGTILSLMMRIHRVWPNMMVPGIGLVKPEDYLAMVTMHGTLMVFFVLLIAPQAGFANLVLPEQIGARRMAFPRINAAAFWTSVVAFLVLISGAHIKGGSAISGWSSYPPLSALPAAGPGQGLGMDLWLISIGIFCIASWLSAVNMLATILGERRAGMTWSRLPMTVWGWLVTSILSLLIFAVLLAAAVLLFSDRHFGSSFFIPLGDMIDGRIVGHGDGSPLLWLHLFWFFGHPGTYLAVLPGMGLATSLFANFTRRRVPGYRVMAGGLVAIGGLGLVVWGHHMFVSGMNPWAGTAFALTTMAIAVPSTIEVIGWLAMLWGGGLRLKTPMLFALGFLSFFIIGGLTGPILAQPALDSYLHNTFFVVAHFHLVMGMAGVFAIFAGVYYWYPLMTGRTMSETLGKLHFWISVVGVYGTFLPMYFAGLAGEPRHYDRLAGPATSFPTLIPLERGITYSGIVLAAAQLIFLWNVFASARRGRVAEENPWQASTLEWATGAEFGRIENGPYEYELQSGGERFHPQWETAAKEE